MMKNIVKGFLAASLLLTGCSSNEQKQEELNHTEQKEEVKRDEIIDEEVVMENDTVKITTKEIGYNPLGSYLGLEIENKADHNIIFSSSNLVINDIPYNDPMSEYDIMGNTNAEYEVWLDDTFLEENSITRIEKIEMEISIFDEAETIIDSTHLSIIAK